MVLFPDHSQFFGRQSNQKTRGFFFWYSVMINTVVHTESESCQKQCLLPICIFISLIPAYVNLNMYIHNPALRSILLYSYTYTHLPPSSRTLMLAQKYTYICQYILLPLFIGTCSSLIFSRTCTCMYVHVHVCMYVCTYEFPVSCLCLWRMCIRSFLPGCIPVLGALRLVCSIPYS